MSEIIERLIAERGIERLVHFTRLINLPTILKLGLVPRQVVREVAPDVVVNDAQRWDGRPWWNCASVTFPNSKMLYSLMLRHPQTRWCIITLSPRILLEKRVLFCQTNAADRRIARLDDGELTKPERFAGMFDEVTLNAQRDNQTLKAADATDVQAEILVRGIVEPAYFDEIYFETSAAHSEHTGLLGRIPGKVSSRRGYFGDRQYFRTKGDGR